MEEQTQLYHAPQDRAIIKDVISRCPPELLTDIDLKDGEIIQIHKKIVTLFCKIRFSNIDYMRVILYIILNSYGNNSSETPKVKMREISEELMLEESYVTFLVKNLHDANIIFRKTSGEQSFKLGINKYASTWNDIDKNTVKGKDLQYTQKEQTPKWKWKNVDITTGYRKSVTKDISLLFSHVLNTHLGIKFSLTDEMQNSLDRNKFFTLEHGTYRKIIENNNGEFVEQLMLVNKNYDKIEKTPIGELIFSYAICKESSDQKIKELLEEVFNLNKTPNSKQFVYEKAIETLFYCYRIDYWQLDHKKDIEMLWDIFKERDDFTAQEKVIGYDTWTHEERGMAKQTGNYRLGLHRFCTNRSYENKYLTPEPMSKPPLVSPSAAVNAANSIQGKEWSVDANVEKIDKSKNWKDEIEKRKKGK